MASYLQLGHDSDNLLSESELSGFSGVVLSPVNYDPGETKRRILPKVAKRSLDLVFDPQLYNPRSDKGSLNAWSYFPSDFQTADTTSIDWWAKVNADLVEAALDVSADKVCSPSTLPRNFSDSYYDFSNQIYRQLAASLSGSSAVPYQTLVVDLADIGRADRAEQIASIALQADPMGIYLVIQAEVAQRLEFTDAESLRGLMLLINYLERAGIPVMVSHCSSDLVLWKAAGASACSTGKFFNLRRFSRSRFDDPQEGGGRLLAYWFEEGLLAFLRQGDLIRLTRNKPETIGIGNSQNHFGEKFLASIAGNPEQACVALGWRQYLNWFILTESQLSTSGKEGTQSMLAVAETSWGDLEAENLHLMEERGNDGNWIRPWRIAMMEFVRSVD